MLSYFLTVEGKEKLLMGKLYKEVDDADKQVSGEWVFLVDSTVGMREGARRESERRKRHLITVSGMTEIHVGNSSTRR